MKYELVTAATVEPVSVEEAARQCAVTDAREHPYLADLIEAARVYVEGASSRQLITATWKAHADRFPGQIELAKPPVQSITAITYVDQAGDTQTLGTSYYQSDLKSKDRPGRIRPAYGCTWPSTRGETVNAVTVEFLAGYGAAGSTVPATLCHAILMLVSHWYSFREPASTNWHSPVPFSVDALISIESWGAYH